MNEKLAKSLRKKARQEKTNVETLKKTYRDFRKAAPEPRLKLSKRQQRMESYRFKNEN